MSARSSTRRAVERIASYAAIGRNEADLVIGGEPARDGDLAKGSFFQPTIFTEVKPDARIAQEEIFGPVTSVIPVDDWDETVRIVNCVKYGLSTSLFTRDVNLAFRSIRDFDSGLGYVNHGTIGAEAHLPFGGTKATGNGHREVGQAALDFFSEWKSVYIDYSGKLQRAQIDTTFVDEDVDASASLAAGPAPAWRACAPHAAPALPAPHGGLPAPAAPDPRLRGALPGHGDRPHGRRLAVRGRFVVSMITDGPEVGGDAATHSHRHDLRGPQRRALPRRALAAPRGRAWLARAWARSIGPGRTRSSRPRSWTIRRVATPMALLPGVQRALDAYLATVKRFVVRTASVGSNEPQEPTSVAATLDKMLKPIQLPDDPVAASYAIGGVLQIELSRKQQLLELPDAASRLRAELELLRRESRLLDDGAHAAGPGLRHRLPPQLGRCVPSRALPDPSRACSSCCPPACARSPVVDPGPTAPPPGRRRRRFTPEPVARPAAPSPDRFGVAVREPSASPAGRPAPTYTVAPGDSLASIARAYGTTTAQLQAWNAARYPSLAANPNVIEPGWVLIVSGDPNVTPRPAPTAAPATRRPAATVGSGCTANNRVAGRIGADLPTIPAPVPASRSPSTWAAAWIRRSTS